MERLLHLFFPRENELEFCDIVKRFMWMILLGSKDEEVGKPANVFERYEKYTLALESIDTLDSCTKLHKNFFIS